MRVPPESFQTRQLKLLLENAKREREEVSLVVASSRKLIERSREIIARLDDTQDEKA